MIFSEMFKYFLNMSEILVIIKFEINNIECSCMKILDKNKWEMVYNYFVKEELFVSFSCSQRIMEIEIGLFEIKDKITIIDNPKKIKAFKLLFGDSFNNDKDIDIFLELFEYYEHREE